MASIGGVSFTNDLYWVTKSHGRNIGQTKTALDGSIIIIRLSPQPDSQSGLHTFRFTWEPHSVVDGLGAIANENQIHTLTTDGDGSYKCYFPEGSGSIKAKPLLPIDENTSFTHSNIAGEATDLYSGTFTVFILE